MPVFFIDHIIAMVGALVFQQTVGVQNAFLLFLQGLILKNEKMLFTSFNFTFHYTDDVILLYNSMFGDCVNRIYPIELAIKDTSYIGNSATDIDLHIEIDSDGQ